MQQKTVISQVVYTAVTSPKAAGFVDKEGKNVGNITGTSDLVLADKTVKTDSSDDAKSKRMSESSTAQTKANIQSRNRSL